MRMRIVSFRVGLSLVTFLKLMAVNTDSGSEALVLPSTGEVRVGKGNRGGSCN